MENNANSFIDPAAKEYADHEQERVELDGLHPIFKSYRSDEPGDEPTFQGVVNCLGKVVISNDKYDYIWNFHNGLAKARARGTKADNWKRKFGFVDRNGKEVIPCIWKSVGEFNDYFAIVQDNDTGLCGMIDVTGRLVVPCIWKSIGTYGEGLIPVQDNSTGLCGYIDLTGKVVIPFQWNEACTFSEGLAIVRNSNNLLGYIDKSGQLAIPCIWKQAEHFKNGQARVTNKSKFFFWNKIVVIDKTGTIIGEVN